jgi:hypothetical protein
MTIGFNYFISSGRKFIIAAAVLTMAISFARSASAQGPKVFQAAGPNTASIQSTIDQFRTALGGVNNNNNPGPLDSGRREINWDGGGSLATSQGPTPFDVFLNNRGNRSTTPGTGFVQATPAGLAELFGVPSYTTIFQPFSPSRVFSAIGSNVSEETFFVPGTAGATVAATKGFGVIFTDVDQPDGGGPTTKRGNRHASTLIEYFDAQGNALFSSFAPASPGDGGLSFIGIVLNDARIASVRITSGGSALGVDDDTDDVVVMDDFIYGEPQAIK